MEINMNVEDTIETCAKIRIFYDNVDITSLLTEAKLITIDERLWDALDKPKEKKAIKQINKLMGDIKNEQARTD